MGLVSGLIMATFSFADYQSQGVVINHTENVLYEGYFNNSWVYTGLSGGMVTVPKVKFLV
jgi:hypothetical protein